MAGLPRTSRKNCASVEISLFAGRLVELDQGQFDLLVAGHVDPLAGPNRLVDVVGELDGHVQERPFAGGAEVGHGRLDQMARAVQLVLDAAGRSTRLPGSTSV